MKLIKDELRIFLTALMFLTRLPVPKNIDHNTADLNKSSRYFPAVGIVVGLIGAVIFLISFLIFRDVLISSFLSLGGTILATGAFHEDGLADTVDGFGGGWTKTRILEIMKDSRIGAFGVISLTLVIGLKIYLLSKLAAMIITKNQLSFIEFGLIYISAHSISRVMPVFLLRFMEYAREDDTSKIKPLATQITWSGFIIAIIFGAMPLLSFICIVNTSVYLLLSILPCGLFTLYLATYFKKWIGGYTGDCLGATQQLNEIIFYLAIVVLWNFTL